jgi:TIR domain
MTVFIAHAPADRDAAEALEKFIERRGQFAELDDGQTAMRPVQPNDVVVLLISQKLVFAPTRLRLEQRSLDAWAEGRLVAVKLDHGIAPVGLRDLPFIDASFEAQREFKWQEVANQIRERLKAPPASRMPPPSGGPTPPWRDHLKKIDAAREGAQQRTEAETVHKSAGGSAFVSLIVCLLLVLPGLGALIAAGSIWLVNRIGPTPGTFADLLAGIDTFGVARGLPSGVTVPIFGAAIVLLVLAPIGYALTRSAARRKMDTYAEGRPEVAEDYEAPLPTPTTDAVFVSYARANATSVLPVIEGAKEQGNTFWLDQQNISGGEGWAGEIVRAIKAAKGVLVMCSNAAFESDHVKREIYLADRYRKKLVPVFIEQADPPEDFEYFFAGVQMTNLFETPEAERPEALARALGAAS